MTRRKPEALTMFNLHIQRYNTGCHLRGRQHHLARAEHWLGVHAQQAALGHAGAVALPLGPEPADGPSAARYA